MATWITHLMIADGVLERIPSLDRHGFCVGNIAPDCVDQLQFVGVNDEANTRARRFYEKHGFKLTEQTKSFNGVMEVMYEKAWE